MPSKRRQLKSGASQKTVSAHNKRLSRQFARELCVGCIIWLPEKVEGGESVKCILPHCCNNLELDSKGYKHYVVILDVFQTDDNKIQCHVAKLTSKVRTGRYSINRIKISQEAPASHPDVENELFLQHGSMPKQSFISLDHAFQISSKLLRPIKTGSHACETRITEQSYIHLMKKLGLKATIYKDTKHVKQLGARILTATPEIPTPAQTPIPSTSALGRPTPDHEAHRTASTVPPQSTTSKPTNPTPQTLSNRPPRSTTTRQHNPSEPYRENIAQRSGLETDSLFQTYQTQRRESERMRVRDLESGGHGESSGPGIWCRCAPYLLARAVYVVEHAPWSKLGWFSVIMVALYYTMMLKAVWPTVQVLGGWLKGTGLWTWKWMLKTIKVLVPWVKDLVVWAGKLIVEIARSLAGCLKRLGVWAWGGISELAKSGLGQLGFG